MELTSFSDLKENIMQNEVTRPLFHSGLTQQYTARQIAQKCCVSYSAARRWIMELNGDDTAMIQKNKGRGKRPWRLRRLDETRLPELQAFINH
jgi:transposase